MTDYYVGNSKNPGSIDSLEVKRLNADICGDKIPVINVLEPATTATELNVPKTKKVLLLIVFFGIIVGIGIVFGKKFWEKNFKEKT